MVSGPTVTRRKEKRAGHSKSVPAAPRGRLHPPIENRDLMCFALIIFSLFVYGRCLSNGFVDYDDHQYITKNIYVQSGLTWATFRWALTTFDAGNWHPITWISHAFDVQVFGLSPVGHHLDSMLVHTVNVVLLFLLLWKATDRAGRSFVVAGLFAAHPLNVECVAWAAERKSLLCTLFFLLALGSYSWFAKRPSISRYLLLALAFACGLLAKPMIVTLPFVLLLIDYWPLRRFDLRTVPPPPSEYSRRSALLLVLEKVPLLVLSIGSAVLTVIAQSGVKAIMPLSTISVSLRIENAICSYALYLWKAVWPSRLALFYPETTVSIPAALFSLAVLGTISALVWRERKKRPYLIVGWLWYLGTLIPVIGLIQVGSQALADRYTYIPMIGIFVIMVWRVGEFCEEQRWSQESIMVATAIVLSVLSILTYRQIGFWRNPLSLWTHSLETTDDNSIAEENLGLALVDAGRNEEAIPHFNRATEMAANDPTPEIGLEIAYKDDNPQMVIAHAKRALTLTSDPKQLLTIYDDLGAAHVRLRDYDEAVQDFRNAIRLDELDKAAMLGLGTVLLRRAAVHLNEQLENHPTAEGFVQLGGLWEQSGDYDDARHAYQSALGIRHGLASAEAGLRRVSQSQSENH